VAVGNQQAAGPLTASWADGATFMRFACTGDHQANLMNDDGAPPESLPTHAAATHSTFPAFAPAADVNYLGSDSCAECHRPSMLPALQKNGAVVSRHRVPPSGDIGQGLDGRGRTVSGSGEPSGGGGSGGGRT
jgi:hypothetical protein